MKTAQQIKDEMPEGLSQLEKADYYTNAIKEARAENEKQKEKEQRAVCVQQEFDKQFLKDSTVRHEAEIKRIHEDRAATLAKENKQGRLKTLVELKENSGFVAPPLDVNDVFEAVLVSLNLKKPKPKPNPLKNNIKF